MAGAVSPTNFGTSASPSAVAPASPAVLVPADWPNCISGPINMLAGVAAACPTDINVCSGSAEASDCTPVTRAGAAVNTPATAGDTAPVAVPAIPAAPAFTVEAKPT